MSFYQLKITWVPIENHLFCLPIIKITCICSIAFFNICVYITLYIIVIHLLPNTYNNTNTNSMFVQNYLSQIKKGFHLQKLESSLNIEIPYCQEAFSPGLVGWCQFNISWNKNIFRIEQNIFYNSLFVGMFSLSYQNHHVNRAPDVNIFHKVQAILISRDHFDINIKVAGRPIEATLIPQVTFSPGL